MGFESSGFEECSGDVVGEVSEVLGRIRVGFEAAVDGFGRAVAGVGVVEVGQDVCGSAFERSSQCDDLCEGARHA